MRVLAVDPGVATGMALYERNGFPAPVEEMEQWVEPIPLHAIDRVKLELEEGLDALVCENFFISGPRAKEANQTIEIIGALRWLAYKKGVPFMLQAPADAKAFGTNEKLKRLGWWEPSSTDHARSASRHLCLFLVSSGHISASRVLPSAEEA